MCTSNMDSLHNDRYQCSLPKGPFLPLPPQNHCPMPSPPPPLLTIQACVCVCVCVCVNLPLMGDGLCYRYEQYMYFYRVESLMEINPVNCTTNLFQTLYS